MSAAELCFFNGRVLPLADAAVSPFDRGHNFGDGVYEMIRAYDGVPFALEAHLDRLFRSARAIEIEPALTREEYRELIHDLLKRAGRPDACVYGQVTRGAESPRAHLPSEGIEPIDFWAVQPAPVHRLGKSVLSREDDRWSRCHVKAISLLPNVMAKRAAARAGADEALYFLPGSEIVTEGCASNAFALKDGAIFSHPVGAKVLPGVTRIIVKELAPALGLEFVEEGRSLDFFRQADEAFITSTTMEAQPLLEIDGRPVNGGRMGPVVAKLRQAYAERVRDELAPALDRSGSLPTAASAA